MRRRSRRTFRVSYFLTFTGGALAGTMALWAAVHQIEGFGPWCADAARAMVGPRVVGVVEDVVYGVADRVNQVRFRDQAPSTFWAEEEEASIAASDSSPGVELHDDVTDFPPPASAPPFPRMAAKGDGSWIALSADPDGHTPLMYKTVIHPDRERSFAAVAIVAMDLRRARLHLMAGTREPESETVPRSERTGLIPAEDKHNLVAVFNGGFKAIHGHYGFMMHGRSFLPPLAHACTIALLRDGSVGIGSWPSLKGQLEEPSTYRQTPPCLVEHGKPNVGLSVEFNRNWGATVSGETVIRRSALGVGKEPHLLYYGLGEFVTAQAIAKALEAVGAVHVAQLDVNHSFPKLMLAEKDPESGEVTLKRGLIPDLQFGPREYIEEPSSRDFFYLTKGVPSLVAQAAPQDTGAEAIDAAQLGSRGASRGRTPKADVSLSTPNPVGGRERPASAPRASTP